MSKKSSSKAKTSKVDTNLQDKIIVPAVSVNADQQVQNQQAQAGVDALQAQQKEILDNVEAQEAANQTNGLPGVTDAEPGDETPVSTAKTVFVTSDGVGHYDQQYATDYSRRLDDERMTTTTDDVFDGPITDIAVQQIETGIGNYEKAEDLEVPSPALKFRDK